ncbi:MAG: SAM-dependent methyltransferase [Acidobacteriota bacterium]|nr:SAM-dependent methyltransferase [Acidobacteriota bacterium]
MSAVADRLRLRIAEIGPIPFASFMEEALYGDGGYYSSGGSPVGRDFVTGSSLSPLFGRTTAALLARLGSQLGGEVDYLEAGFGGGQHLAAVAGAWSEDRGRFLAWDRAGGAVPRGVERIGAPATVGEGSLRGLVFSYELLDALSVHRLIGRADGSLGELWVESDGAELRYVEGDLSDARLVDLLGGVPLEAGQIADLSPEWVPLYESLASRIDRGLIVTCDYGFARQGLLDPRVRRNGTLACYRSHQVHRNPFEDVGSQDLTAHVDFTALRVAGEAQGFETIAFSRQALWLAGAGLFELIRGASATERGEAMALLDGEGMGEEIRVLVQGKGVDASAVFDLQIVGAAACGVP